MNSLRMMMMVSLIALSSAVAFAGEDSGSRGRQTAQARSELRDCHASIFGHSANTANTANTATAGTHTTPNPTN